jgi:hypothetical protein
MKTLHRFMGTWLFIVLLSPLSAARPTGLEPQDAKTEEVEQEADFTALDPDLSEEELAGMGAEAFALVKQSYKTELESVTFRFGTAEEIAEIIKEENIAVMARTLPEGTEQEDIEATAEQFSESLSEGLLAKFSLGKNEILVNLEVFFKLDEELGLTGIASYEVLQAVLVHESVHAIDDVEFSLAKMEEFIVDVDSSQTVNALIEGHAQFWSRRVCAAHDMTAAFERFSSAISFVPETDDPLRAIFTATYIAQMMFWYEEGERFFLAVHDAKGLEGVREVFQAPPTESVLISQPDWYLDPASRPEAEFDLEERLGVILELASQSDRTMTKMNLLKPQIAAGLALLPEVEVESVLAELQESLMGFHQGRNDFFSVGLFSMSSAVWSRAFYNLEEELLYAKDEAMKEGSVKILSSVYEFLEEGSQHGEAVVGNFEGLYCKKAMEVGPMEMEISNLIAVRGRTVIEIAAMEDGEAGSIEQLVFLANLLLDPDVAADMLEKANARFEEEREAELYILLPESPHASSDNPHSDQFRPAIEIPQGVDLVGADGAHISAPPEAYGIQTAWGYSLGHIPDDLKNGETQLSDDSLYSTQGTTGVGPGDRSVLREYLRNAASRMGRSFDSSTGEELELADDSLFIRADKHSLFKYTQIVMEECAAPEVRIWNIQLAITGGKSITFPLPKGPAKIEEERIEIVISVVHEGDLVDVTKARPYDSAVDDFYAYDDTRELTYLVGEKEYDAARRVRSRLKLLLRKNEDLVAVIQPGPGVLTQEVIDIYDGLLDAEVTKIYFAATEEE